MSDLKKFPVSSDSEPAEEYDNEDFPGIFFGFPRGSGAYTEEEITEETAQTSYDYYELSQKTRLKKKKQEYLEKALELDEENFDARAELIRLTCKSYAKALEQLSQAVENASDIMKKKGYMEKEYMGEYWLIYETRPYMRLRYGYMYLLTECGMFKRAVQECQELLRLCKGDNLGIRYTLMHLYAYLEMENEALRLYKKYSDYGESQLLLPLSILYYKLGKTELALKYLNELVLVNKDTKKFVREMKKSVKDVLMSSYRSYEYEYEAGGYEEFVTCLSEYPYLYTFTSPYFEWADEQLKGRRKSSGGSKGK